VTGDRPLRVAAIGCGGKGYSNIAAVAQAGGRMVALCDVDLERGSSHFRSFPDLPRYKDFRDMLREMDEAIDAVIVSTPDHMHFPAALMAVEMGKHVYVEKPITHTVTEARQLAEAARRHEVITQMGNQGHANEGTRLMREWVQAGAIGLVREVHVWTNRPIWPQGMDRPEGGRLVPPHLDWNLWLGVAPARPYNHGYQPFAWRGWWDFGCGALGDMGCHHLDASFWALDLGSPTSVEAETSPFNDEAAPQWSIVTYQFPARGELPPVKLVWYDGGKMPPRPPGLEEDRELSSNGQYLVGEKGVIMDSGSYCQSPRLVPETAMKAFMPNRPPKTIPRVPNASPQQEWMSACKGGPKPGSNFVDHAGPLTEMVLLGNVAIRARRRIEWDAQALRITNAPEANQYLSKSYRLF
jgi:predicted dehydrogenase